MEFKILSIFLLSMVMSALSKPIMVSFGTNQGPIVPRPKTSPQPYNIIQTPHNPAPVSEATDDVPNPVTYRPLVPHQYRTKLYSYKPNPNLIFGTPLDRKFSLESQKIDYNLYNTLFQKQHSRDYTGPYLFEKQPYEYENFNRKTLLIPSQRYNQPQQNNNNGHHQRYVPQIGVLYSAGVRYYVPQYQPHQQQQDQHENSVYDKTDGESEYRQ